MFFVVTVLFLKSWLGARGWVIEFPKPDKSLSNVLLPDPVRADPKEGN